MPRRVSSSGIFERTTEDEMLNSAMVQAEAYFTIRLAIQNCTTGFGANDVSKNFVMFVAEWSDNPRCAVVILNGLHRCAVKSGNSHLPGVTSPLLNQSPSLRTAL